VNNFLAVGLLMVLKPKVGAHKWVSDLLHNMSVGKIVVEKSHGKKNLTISWCSIRKACIYGKSPSWDIHSIIMKSSNDYR
jgi:hypothetical protein